MSNLPESGFVFIRDEVIAAASTIPPRAEYILTSTTLYTSIQSLGNGESFTSADGRKWYIIEGFGGAGDPTKSVLSVVGQTGHVNATQLWNGLGVAPEGNIPERLRIGGKRTTNWNATREAGFYYSDYVTGLPTEARGWITGMVLRHGTEGFAHQFIYQQNSGKMWRRAGGTTGNENDWQPWKEVLDTETDIAEKMNPRYAFKSHKHPMSDVNGLIDALAANKTTWVELGEIPEANMRARLQEYGQLIDDWNDATKTGFYRSLGARNVPEATMLFGFVEAYDDQWITQTVHGITVDKPADTVSYRRERNFGAWGAWYKLRISEAEQKIVNDALYAAKNHTHAITDVTGLRGELDSLTAGGGTGGNMDGRAYPRLSNGNPLNFAWTGTTGTPAWVFGGASATDVRVYNPMNWNINTATQTELNKKETSIHTWELLTDPAVVKDNLMRFPALLTTGEKYRVSYSLLRDTLKSDYNLVYAPVDTVIKEITGAERGTAISDSDVVSGHYQNEMRRWNWTTVRDWIKGWIKKADVGLGNVDNTSDANKPVSTAANTALNGKLSLSGGTMSGEVTMAKGNAFRLAGNGAASIMHRYDGANYYILISDTQTGTWNNLRPFAIDTSNGVLINETSHYIKMTGNGDLAIRAKTLNSNSTTINNFNVSGRIRAQISRGAFDDPNGGYGEFFYEEHIGQRNSAVIRSNGFNENAYFYFDSKGHFTCAGQIRAGSKSFVIDHPLDPYNKNLVHTAIETANSEVQYHGMVKLVNGRATIDVDEVYGLTAGTISALSHKGMVTSLVNKTGFSAVRYDFIDEGKFEIICQDETSTDEIVWYYTAIRRDPYTLRIDPNIDRETGEFIAEQDKV